MIETCSRSSTSNSSSRCPREPVGLDLLVALLAWQVAWLVALFCELIELDAYASIHVATSIVLAVCALCYARAEDGDYTSLQIVAWSTLAGPFGACVAAALLLRPTPSASCRDNPTADGDEREPMERIHVALLDRRIRVENGSSIRSLVDVMADGSQSEKLAALGVVYRNYGADLIPVLRQALQDTDAAVRVLAATVAAKLNGTFTRAIGDRQAAADASPELAHNWRQLADARLAYAASELLDRARVCTEIEVATRDLGRAAYIDPHDRDTASRLNRAQRQLVAWKR